MRLENQRPEIESRGGELVAVMVDSPGRNAAFVRRWRLSFPIVSDPGGTEILRPLEVWNEGERGGIGIPSVRVLAPDGREAFCYRSRDFADRPDDGDVLAALDDLGLPPVDPGPWRPEVEPDEQPDAFRTDAFGAYFRGVWSSALALSVRLTDEGDRAEAARQAGMAISFQQAWKQRREAAPG